MVCLLLEQLLVQSLVCSASSCVIWGACEQSNPICYPFYHYVTHVRLCARLFPSFHTASNKKLGGGLGTRLRLVYFAA